MFFFLRNSSPLFSITRSCSLYGIHVSINTKNNAEKDTTLLLSGRPVISFQIKPWVAFGLPYLLIELLYVGMPVVRTNGRSLAWCTVTWLPNFLGWVDYHISLAMALRPGATRELRYKSCQMLTKELKNRWIPERNSFKWRWKRVSMGWWLLRLSAKILAFLRLSVNLFQLRLTKKLKINFFCFKKLNIN